MLIVKEFNKLWVVLIVAHCNYAMVDTMRAKERKGQSND